jgi:hypothetical protein
MVDRRSQPRARLGPVLLNKYIDGFPHMAVLVDISESGMLLRKIHEPNLPRSYYSVELAVPSSYDSADDDGLDRIWLWTRSVRVTGEYEEYQALRFVGLDPETRAKIARLVEEAHAA